MSKSVETIQNRISSTIEATDAKLEEIWGKMAEITHIACAEEENFAMTRLLSYNPQSAHAKSLKDTLKPAYETVCQLINNEIKTIQSNPNCVPSWAIMGHCYLLLNDFPNAYACYGHVSRIDPSFSDAAFLYCYGCVHQHFDFHAKAIESFKKALNINQSLADTTDIRLRIGLSARALNSYQEAMDSFNDSIENLPNGWTRDDVNFAIAYTKQLANDVRGAMNQYQKLLDSHPDSLPLIHQYTWFLSRQSDPSISSSAKDIALEALNRFDGDPALSFTIGQLAMKTDDMETAYNYYLKCITFWSDSPFFWCSLGSLYYKNNQMDDALIAFQKAVNLNSEIAEVYMNIGLIYEKGNNAEQALKIYAEGIQNCGKSGKTRALEKLQERYSFLNSTGRTKLYQMEICEANEKYGLAQEAQKVVEIYTEETPDVPISVISEDGRTRSELKKLLLPHRSLFRH